MRKITKPWAQEMPYDTNPFILLFNESALRPIHSISCDVRLCVCVFVRHTLETTLPEGLETSGRMAYR